MIARKIAQAAIVHAETHTHACNRRERHVGCALKSHVRELHHRESDFNNEHANTIFRSNFSYTPNDSVHEHEREGGEGVEQHYN